MRCRPCSLEGGFGAVAALLSFAFFFLSFVGLTLTLFLYVFGYSSAPPRF